MFLNQLLIEIASVAIWNRKKVIVVASIIIWCVNVGFLIQGKSLLSFPAAIWKHYTNVVW
jgi:hypothetical protein